MSWEQDPYDDVFQWLLNGGAGDPQDDGFGAAPAEASAGQGGAQQRQVYHAQQPQHMQPDTMVGALGEYVDGVHYPGSMQQHMDGIGAENGPGFGWANDLLVDSPYYPAPTAYTEVTPLTDDMDGAMDVVMGGPQNGHPGVAPAMQAFATEAATGQRRRGAQAYYQSQHAQAEYEPQHTGDGSYGFAAQRHLQQQQHHPHHHQQEGAASVEPIPPIDYIDSQEMPTNPTEPHMYYTEDAIPDPGLGGHLPQHQGDMRHSQQLGGYAAPGADPYPVHQQPTQATSSGALEPPLPPQPSSRPVRPVAPVARPTVPARRVPPPISVVKQEDMTEGAQSRGSPTAAGGSASSRRKPAAMSPKSLAQRERNREAVRNCRKRKREYAQKLKERETMLGQENARLRLQLKLGSEEMQSNMMRQCHQLATQMKEVLKGKKPRPAANGAAPPSMTALTEEYIQTNANQGRNREEATKHIISRLLRQVEPTHVTKMYLWQTAQADSYFKARGGLWNELRTRLDLSKEQLKALRARRLQVLEMCKEIAAVLEKLDNLHTLILKRKRLSGENLLFRNIAAELSKEQLAKLIVFVHEFPSGGKHEADWEEYLASFDKELEQERLNRAGIWVVHNPGTAAALKGSDESNFNRQRTSFVADGLASGSADAASALGSSSSASSSAAAAGSHALSSSGSKTTALASAAIEAELADARAEASGAGDSAAEVDDDLMRNRHKSAIVLKELFERSEEELMGFAKAAFSPNIDLYDPNTVRVIHGIDKVLKYIRRIRCSFEGLTATEENFMTRKNVARGRWTLTGTYYGFGLKNPHAKAAAKAKAIAEGTNPAKAAAALVDDGMPRKPEGKRVSFKVVIAYRFIPGSAQIQQLLVSWAALDVMRQLGLLPESFRETLGDRMKQESLDEIDGSKRKRAEADLESPKAPVEDATRSSPSPSELDSPAPPSNLPPVALPKLDQKLKESKCIELTRIFQVDTPEERLDIADELLDDNCVFQDANMGGAFMGPDACVDYVRRLRRPFSTMEMTRHNFVSVNKRKRGNKIKREREAKAAKAAAAAAAAEAAANGSGPDVESRTQMGCLVKGMYSGALVNTPRPYEFNTTIFVTFNHENNKILEVEMSWNAAGLMKQLGVLQ